MSFHHLPVASGTCVFCREADRIISWLTSDGALGVCDVCSYALRHAWQKQRGEALGASTPALVRTYVLVPRLKAGRAEEDISAYEFLVLEDGGLPYVEWSKRDEDLCLYFARKFKIMTWPETVRPCYLGYAGSTDFSVVKLAWAWGKMPLGQGARPSGQRFAGFAELLALSTPDVGFHLGIKAAFESLLWRREVAPEGNKLCVFMREPAVRYLLSLDIAAGSEPDDEAMVEVCHQAMSADELEVAEILEKARANKPDDAFPEETAKVASEKTIAGDSEADGDEGSDDDNGDGNETVDPGFARSRGKIIAPGDK